MNSSLLLLLLLWWAGAPSASPPQTVVPPGSVPGAQTVVTPDMRNAGSPRGRKDDAIAPGMSRQDRKQLRKLAKQPAPGQRKPRQQR